MLQILGVIKPHRKAPTPLIQELKPSLGDFEVRIDSAAAAQPYNRPKDMTIDSHPYNLL